jgi:hypothetical protein
VSVHQRGTLTVGDVTVEALFQDADCQTVIAMWMPDTEGIDMGIVAVPGADAQIEIPAFRRPLTGKVAQADREDCRAWIRVQEG